MKKKIVMSGEGFNLLQKSIKLWKGVIKGKKSGKPQTDPLCVRYAGNSISDCEGCPLAIATGHEFCDDTAFSLFLDYCSESGYATTEEAVEAAQQYLSLLEKVRDRARIMRVV